MKKRRTLKFEAGEKKTRVCGVILFVLRGGWKKDPCHDAIKSTPLSVRKILDVQRCTK